MKTVIYNWKCAQRQEMLNKLCSARLKGKSVRVTSSTQNSSRSQSTAGTSAVSSRSNRAGLYSIQHSPNDAVSLGSTIMKQTSHHNAVDLLLLFIVTYQSNNYRSRSLESSYSTIFSQHKLHIASKSAFPKSIMWLVIWSVFLMTR